MLDHSRSLAPKDFDTSHTDERYQSSSFTVIVPIDPGIV